MGSKLVTVKMPKKYVDALEALVHMGLYSSKSEAIRAAVRDLLRRHGFFVANPKNCNCRREVRVRI